MKMNPIILVVGCLCLGLFGCATKDGQVGYLSPQQTTSGSEGDVAVQTIPAGEASSATSISRLPPPSLVKPIPDTNLSQPSPAPVQSSSLESQSLANTVDSPAIPEQSAAIETQSTVGEEVMQEPSSSPPPAEIQPSSLESQLPESQPLANTVDSPDAQEQKVAVASQPAKKEEVVQAKQEPAVQPATNTSGSSITSNFGASETRIAELTVKRGAVELVNQEAKFAVVKFQYGVIPAVGNKLAVLRNGERIGEVVVTKPVKPPHATVDILEGSIFKGDIVE